MRNTTHVLAELAAEAIVHWMAEDIESIRDSSDSPGEFEDAKDCLTGEVFGKDNIKPGTELWISTVESENRVLVKLSDGRQFLLAITQLENHTEK